MDDQYKRSLYDRLTKIYRKNFDGYATSYAPKLSPYSGLAVFNESGVSRMGAGWDETDFEGLGMSEKEIAKELEGIFKTEKKYRDNEYTESDLSFFKNQGQFAHEYLMKKAALDSVNIRDIINFLHSVDRRK